ncbi:hypothetical protein EVAR_46938_1 [Eumeta japonica]|uniref:Uncharacterized protein n=1 Tax=Eumeta variegata TaxID=151549 RepID=A0A4C2A2S6_EUMVA|nr:hypothetical protein EVAR_46938_1 [Eumeta japonica]
MTLSVPVNCLPAEAALALRDKFKPYDSKWAYCIDLSYGGEYEFRRCGNSRAPVPQPQSSLSKYIASLIKTLIKFLPTRAVYGAVALRRISFLSDFFPSARGKIIKIRDALAH